MTAPDSSISSGISSGSVAIIQPVGSLSALHSVFSGASQSSAESCSGALMTGKLSPRASVTVIFTRSGPPASQVD